MKAQIRFLEGKVEDATRCATSVENIEKGGGLPKSVRQALTNVVSSQYSRYGEKWVAREMVDVIWSTSFFNGVVRDEVYNRAKQSIKEIFLGEKNITRDGLIIR